MHFADPNALFLLLALPLVLWWSLRGRRGALRYSNLALGAGLPSLVAGWGPALLAFLRVLTVALLIVALARPQTIGASAPARVAGLAIQLVLDNSYSMRTRDYDDGGEFLSRLDAVKYAVRLFVAGGEHGLTGRPNDKIGIITFARDPEVVCPLTLDHEAVLQALDRITLAPPVGTNIGDALAWRWTGCGTTPPNKRSSFCSATAPTTSRKVCRRWTPPSSPPTSRSGPTPSARSAITSIGRASRSLRTWSTPLHNPHSLAGDSVDEPMMQRLAARTGGQYYRATDTAGLLNIYRAIDRLETTPLDRSMPVSYREWFLALLLPAVALLLLERLLAATRLLQVP